ncbi:MAG: hypothetical protein R3E66_14145 [bacterium]
MNTEKLIQLLVSSMEAPASGEDQRLMKLLGSALVAVGGVMMSIADTPAAEPDTGKIQPQRVSEPNTTPPQNEAKTVPPANEREFASPTLDPQTFGTVNFIESPELRVFAKFHERLDQLDFDNPSDARSWLRRAINGFGEFKLLPDDSKQRYLELLVAIARWISPANFMQQHFADLRALKENFVDAYVYGLGNQHAPRKGDWLTDAKELLDDLRTPESPETQGVIPKKKTESKEPCASKSTSIDPAVLSFTRGKTLAIVGGIEKASARTNLMNALELADVRWVTTKKKNQVKSALIKLQNDDIDLAVVTVRFTSHGAQQQMRAIDSQRVIFTKGYGVGEIEQAISDWLKKAA